MQNKDKNLLSEIERLESIINAIDFDVLKFQYRLDIDKPNNYLDFDDNYIPSKCYSDNLSPEQLKAIKKQARIDAKKLLHAIGVSTGRYNTYF